MREKESVNGMSREVIVKNESKSLDILMPIAREELEGKRLRFFPSKYRSFMEKAYRLENIDGELDIVIKLDDKKGEACLEFKYIDNVGFDYREIRSKKHGENYGTLTYCIRELSKIRDITIDYKKEDNAVKTSFNVSLEEEIKRKAYLRLETNYLEISSDVYDLIGEVCKYSGTM